MFRKNKILLASRLCNHNTNFHRFPPGWSLMYYVLVRIDRARFGLAIHLIYLLKSSTGFGRVCPCQGSIWGGGRVDSGLCHFLILLNFADFCHFSTKIRQHHEKLTFFAEKGHFFNFQCLVNPSPTPPPCGGHTSPNRFLVPLYNFKNKTHWYCASGSFYMKL